MAVMKGTHVLHKLRRSSQVVYTTIDITGLLPYAGTSADSAVAPRRAWIRLLSRAPLEMLEAALAHLAGPLPRWLRRPETGLVMVQGRIGGSGARFNLGEVTVTRCALRPDPALLACNYVGIAYVMGRSARHAELAATADALLQDPTAQARVPADLLGRITASLDAEHTARRAKALATKVEFFTVARERAATAGPEQVP